MGNRAVVIFEDSQSKNFSPAVYLHWNGGPESVYAFLDELDVRQIRADQEYEAARFIQIVGEFFGHEGLSLGVFNGPETDLELTEDSQFNHGDNGIYLVCRENKERRMRRFNHVNYPEFRELTEEEVEKEKNKAYEDDYMQPEGIPSTFRKIRESRINV
jgi:hypothetical protein